MSRPLSYRIASEAREDLAGIWLYVFDNSGSERADGVLAKLREAMDLIGEEPEAGHLREDLTQRPVRFWSVFRYLIVYNPASKPVEVLRVFHGAMDIESRL